MRYRRVLLVAELGSDPGAALAAARGLAPEAERLVVVACPPAQPSSWWSGASPPEPPEPASPWLDRLRDAAARVAPETEVGLVPALDAESLGDVVAASGVELVVAGPVPLAAIPVLAELRKRRPVAVLWVPTTHAPEARRPVRELFCVALGERAQVSVARFLRDHGDPAMHATIFAFALPSGIELTSALEVAGIRASVELAGAGVPAPWRALDELARLRSVDLVVLARYPGSLLRSVPGSTPILVLPPLVPGRPAIERPLDVADLVDDGGVVRVRVEHAFGVGRNPPIADQEIAFVHEGRVAALVTTHGGEAELPPGLGAESLGLFRVRDRASEDPVAAIERWVTIVRPGPRPLVLFDVDLPDAELPALAAVDGAELLAVRLRPSRSCHLLRDRLRAAGLAARVVDARAVLDEGDAADVSESIDAVRLARVATRLLRTGFPVAAIVHHGPRAPAAVGFVALSAAELAGRTWERPTPAPRPSSLGARLDATTGAARLDGHRVELELDNATARRWLLGAIEGAAQRLHLQSYMATDDDLGRRVETALREAARRGVAVRVLVDSLHGLHGSFGMRNPLLERLAACPGVELRVSRPLAGVPSLEDLKQRDHGKLVVADGRLALLGGRNLAAEYYTGFDEVNVVPSTPWRDVPWLDAGARLLGPAVATLERSFLEAWTGAGGAPFEVVEQPPAGTTPARVVVHRGLCDAGTLEAYLALIETARTHVVAVSGFPLLLEIQHALLRALARGVRVRTLFGRATPTHGGEPFEGQWATARTAATWLVHSRMDALVAAGAEGFELAVRDVPGWAPDLGLVHPHVHAKIMSVDGRVCAIGSANLDVTASYWESELLLLVEDEAVAGALEARIDAFCAGSVRVDREDPAWQRLARRREWLRHWPGVLSV
ncbi:MAG: phosphatidylserine/phosphatidylglycerophosphate/cardiolipin synthase family protein [Polyangiaceae bacterium]|nr:phosphatidylserine/phosphatidylglycerophosphate/cardiolipin synthase family protein [Polyangiaceae bacterium]